MSGQKDKSTRNWGSFPADSSGNPPSFGSSIDPGSSADQRSSTESGSSTNPEGPPAALPGLRILDFSRVLAGPFATMLLADLGAEVIKVERPGSGDDTRAWGPPYDQRGQSTYFDAVNRNKRSVVIDLGTADGVAQAKTLAATADVLVENFRPRPARRPWARVSRAELKPIPASSIARSPDSGAADQGRRSQATTCWCRRWVG